MQIESNNVRKMVLCGTLQVKMLFTLQWLTSAGIKRINVLHSTKSVHYLKIFYRSFSKNPVYHVRKSSIRVGASKVSHFLRNQILHSILITYSIMRELHAIWNGFFASLIVYINQTSAFSDFKNWRCNKNTVKPAPIID